MALINIITGQKLMEIVAEETNRLANKQTTGTLTGGDTQALERLAKTYHVLQTELREAEKGFNNLPTEDLEKLLNDSTTSGDSSD